MAIRKSAEDYLEAMLVLRERRGFVRSVDVAEELGVKKPSVTYMTKRLKEEGYIEMDGDSLISLTPSGLAIAEDICRRHRVLTELLVRLGVPAETARADACKLEHDLSPESFAAICRHVGAE